MKVLAVVGRKNTGKTSLVEALLEAIPEHKTVATIKSIHHEVEFDEAGTDTYRHRQAGADAVVGMTPGATAEFRPEGKSDGVTLQGELSRLHERGFDWVIVEGFKTESLATIVVGDLPSETIKGSVIERIVSGTAGGDLAVSEWLSVVPDWRPAEDS
ncbi:MAG: molybdopterin-guanine dinucleotide biosynthesis protein B [Halodesulfurarchaeum sp.]